MFAGQADYALIIRRGPSKSVCSLGWDRGTNTFQVGQWINGRIYEYDCDLSPNGKYLIYKAFSTKWDGRRFGCTTAISRTPYLKPIGLWHSREGTWIAGGFFIDDSQYWIKHGRLGHDTILPPTDLSESPECPFKGYGEYLNIYFLRLQRDGWRRIERQKLNSYTSEDVFDKPVDPVWTLRKKIINTIASAKPRQGKGCWYDEHQLLCSGDTSETLDYPAWEWADADHRGLYWAEKGKLFTAQLSKKGLESITELYDFNPMKYEQIDAPY